MTVYRNLLLLGALALPLAATAQEPTDVSSLTGDYHDFNIIDEDGTFKVIGCCGDMWVVDVSPLDRGFSMLTIGDSDTDAQERTTYFADEEAYPVTYISGRYQGNAAMIEAHHAVEYRSEERIVIVGERIYKLTDWNGPNDFEIDTVLQPGWPKGLKRFIKTFKMAIENPGPEYYDELHAYLDAGFARQTELLPAWTAANQGLVTQRAAATQAVADDIASYNDAYRNTDEYIAAHSGRASGTADPTSVRFRNDTPQEVAVMTELGTVTTVNAGSSTTFMCGQGDVYAAHLDSSGSWQKDNLLFDTETLACGAEILASGR